MYIAFEFLVEVPYWFRRHDFLRQVNRKGAAFSVNALNAHVSVHHPQQVLCYGESQPCTFDGVILHEVNPLEFPEQLRQILLLDSDSCISDFHDKINDFGFRVHFS